MWPRVMEILLGLWLAASPLVLGYEEHPSWFWINDFLVAGAIIGVALVSFWPPLRRAYLLQIAIAMWLIGYGFLATAPPSPPAMQNAILVGMFLLMFGIIPNQASQPPRSWRKLNESLPQT
jgi:hypothetical protein